jgi:hypothetical protein
VPVLGFIDRIDKTDDGKLVVLDYKTGKKFEKDRVNTDAQLTMYQMACEELLGMEVSQVSFYHLNSLTEYVGTPHTKKQVKELRTRVVTVAESIEKKLFEPTPDERKCMWCDFKPHCPVYKDHYTASSPSLFGSGLPLPEPVISPAPALAGLAVPAAAPASRSRAAVAGKAAPKPVVQTPLLTPRPEDDEELAALVDAFGRKMDEAARVQAESDQLSQALAEKLRAKGWTRAFGSAYEAALSVEEKWEFDDKAKVLDSIRKSGHWDDIQAPSGPLVQKLMNNPALPPDLRKRLEALGRKVSRPVLRAKRTE